MTTTQRQKRTYTTAFEAARTLGTLFSPEGFTWETELPPRAKHVPLLIHISCNAHFTTFIAYIAQEILKKLGLEFAVVGGPENCCGSIQKNIGDTDLEADVATKAQLGFNRAKPRKVLSICPDCDDVFSEYPLQARSFEHSNISDLVIEYLDRLKPMMKPVDKRVIVHYHDVSPSRVKDTERMTAILGAIPGIEILPATRAHGPGIHCQTVHPMAPADQAAMFEEAKALRADALVVPYHSCYRQHIKMQLEHGVPTEHYFCLLAQALGIEYDEPFKRYRLVNDIDTVMDMLRPKIERFGFDEALVRIFVDRAVFC
jgi:heterodisulfide reductase subunit D